MKPAYEESLLEEARRSHLFFMDHTWTGAEDFQVGFHTQRICSRIDRAMQDFRNGKSTYLAVAVHNRAGKSEIMSVTLPPHFLGEFPSESVMAVTYSSDITYGFSQQARAIVRSPEYQELYPDMSMSPDSQAVGRWKVRQAGNPSNGTYFAAGLNAGLTGRGAHLALLDDYVSGRADAESKTIRNKIWASFTNDFLSRLAPVHIVIILATWWHHDDIRGRIQNITNPESEKYDENFPKFEFMDFPANAEDYTGQGMYPGPKLFSHVRGYNADKKEMEIQPGRYTEEWYKAQRAFFGPYAAAGILDCRPHPKGGSILKADEVQFHQTMASWPADMKWMRVYDYAHTAVQRTGDDPDYTGCTLMAVNPIGFDPHTRERLYEIYVQHYEQYREGAPKRDARIRAQSVKDGNKVRIIIEASLDSLDGARTLKDQLLGTRRVTLHRPKGDKVVRCTPIEPVFEAARVHALIGPWNKVWKDGLEAFDGTDGEHDEMVDNLTCGFDFATNKKQYKPLTVGVH